MTEMRQVIATRDLVRVRTDGVRETFTVEVGLPFLGPDSATLPAPMHYICPMRIVGIEVTPVVHVAYGRDTASALQNALSMAGAILSGMPFAEEFVESGIPNMGFHVHPFNAAMGKQKLTDKQQLLIRHIKGEIDLRTPSEAAAFAQAKPSR